MQDPNESAPRRINSLSGRGACRGPGGIASVDAPSIDGSKPIHLLKERPTLSAETTWNGEGGMTMTATIMARENYQPEWLRTLVTWILAVS
jgi:hypothetical protein